MQAKVFYFSFLIVSYIVLFTTTSYSQISDLSPISTQYQDVKLSAVVAITDLELLVFYVNVNQDSIFSVRSYNQGQNWETPSFVATASKSLYPPLIDASITATKLDSTNLLLYYSKYRDSITVLLSTDIGRTWNISQKFHANNAGGPLLVHGYGLSISNPLNNTRYLSYANPTILKFRKSTDGGRTFPNPSITAFPISSIKESIGIVTKDNANLFFYFLASNSIKYVESNDSGVTWSQEITSIELEDSIVLPRIVQQAGDKIIITYHKITNNIYGKRDIYMRVSEDFGNNWQQEIRLTKFAGDDVNANPIAFMDGILIPFSTQRFDTYRKLSLIIPGKIEEIKTPPHIQSNSSTSLDSLKNHFIYSVRAFDDEAITKVEFSLNDYLVTGELFDDGMHSDGKAFDSLFANIFELPRLNNYDSYFLEENNLKIPVNNRGVIAAVRTSSNLDGVINCYDNLNHNIQKQESFVIYTSNAGGVFDSVVFLFSGGFFMSGLHRNTIWANAVASAALVEDYVAGNVGSDPADKKNSIYVLKANDIPFGRSWQAWKDAVERGAEFYDGDDDGVYNPFDKNFNGIWDPDEDMPMLLGDETVWCVYNDGVPDSLRRWQSSTKDIEVAQTIFASAEPGLENVMFLRYKITNKSNVDYDSVYFGFWADTDLGDAVDDLIGCDTLLNSGFVYNDGSDNWYDYFGDEPPAFFTTLLQGPIVETNSPADTADQKFGEILGSKKTPNSKNLNITAQIFYIGGDPILTDPNVVIQVRNYLMGKNGLGLYLDPCTFPYGHVFGGVDCNEVDKHFWFSGDPVNQIGWIDTTPSDKRNLLSTGPFKLKANEPVDLISAFIVGRGTDALNSITVTRGIVQGVLEEYQNNFSRLTYKSGAPTNPVVSYELYQNYPNPFNPITTIRYALPQDGIVTIKIFDILGQEVVTLKNEFQKANRYEVKFDSKGLASGVYIYRLQVNNYLESKKMILLK